jgi:predicted phosphodiesterase
MVEQLDYHDYAFLRGLPHKLELQLGGLGRILGVHAVPGDDEGRIRPDTPTDEIRGYLQDQDIRFFLFGHTHIPMQRTIDNIQLINPGSVGLLSSPEPCGSYALLEFSSHACQVKLHQVAYDFERVVSKLQKSSYPGAHGLLHQLCQRQEAP